MLKNKHSDVFEEVVLRIMLKLEVDPSVTPRFHKARSIQFALKEKVERELQKLEDQGIISPVTHSDWAAPIVPVVKQNSNVRICGDSV